MILILSDKSDVHADAVIEKINSENLPHYRLNLDVQSLKKTFVTFINGDWTLIQEKAALDLKKVKCVWSRRTFVELMLDEQYDQSADFKIWKGEWNKVLLGIYASLRNKPWLNPWRKAYEAENKYLQMELAWKHGFNIPQTISSNNKEDLLAFANRFNTVALKLMNQDFYKTETGEFQGLYVNIISLEDLNKNFNDLEENPIVLQQYIDKDYEVRYTVIGKNHLACKIESQRSELAKTDWRRYDIPNTPHSAIEPPSEIKSKVNNLMMDLSLEYGALDFIVDKNQNWWFLEVNSMGQFLWIQDLSGLDITGAFVNWFKTHFNT